MSLSISSLAQATTTGWTLPSTAAYLGSVLTAQFVGAVWYSPSLFKERRIQLSHPGLSPSQIERKIRTDGYAVLTSLKSAMICSALGFFLLRGILRGTNVRSPVDGAGIGIFVAAVGGVFGLMHPFFEHRAWQLYIINQGYNFVCFALAGAILAAAAGGKGTTTPVTTAM